MKLKKVLAVSLAAAMTLSMAACGGSSSDSSAASDDATTGSVAATTTESGDAAETTDGALNYASIKLGEDYTDITTTIHVFNQRTDMSEDSYPGKNWEAYIADFNEMYPNITVEVETDTNYSDDSLLRLQSGDWGDIMMIPAIPVSRPQIILAIILTLLTGIPDSLAVSLFPPTANRYLPR